MAANPNKVVSQGLKILAELVVPIVCVLVAVVLVFLIVIPGIEDIQERQDVKKTKEVELSKYEEKNRKLNSLSSRIQELDEYLSLATHALPDDDAVPELMTQLQNIADEAGAVVSNLQYGGGGAVSDQTGPRAVRVQMGIEGDYLEIETLLKLAENASRVVLLDRFDFSVRKEASMSASLSFSSFFLAPPDKTQIDTPITLELSSPDFQEALGRIEALKVYEVTVEEGDVGKENPFSE